MSTRRWGSLASKTEKFFVCVFSKKYMKVVWDIQTVVPTKEVAVRDERGGGDTEPRQQSDI